MHSFGLFICSCFLILICTRFPEDTAILSTKGCRLTSEAVVFVKKFPFTYVCFRIKLGNAIPKIDRPHCQVCQFTLTTTADAARVKDLRCFCLLPGITGFKRQWRLMGQHHFQTWCVITFTACISVICLRKSEFFEISVWILRNDTKRLIFCNKFSILQMCQN
jgi:hypothetical protein